MRAIVALFAVFAALPASGQPFEFARTPEPIVFSNGDARLAGVLLEPDGRPPFPAAVLAASKDPAVAFVVMSSGSAVRPSEQVLWWTRTSLRAKGFSAARIEQAIELKQEMWAFSRSVAAGGRDAAALASIRASLIARSASFADARPEVPSAIPDPATEDRRRFSAFVAMIDYDPAPALRALRSPLLEAIGMNDEVVEPASTIETLERLRAGGGDVTVLRLPDVGHSLLVMKDGRIAGYPPGYLESIVKWAADRAKR